MKRCRPVLSVLAAVAAVAVASTACSSGAAGHGRTAAASTTAPSTAAPSTTAPSTAARSTTAPSTAAPSTTDQPSATALRCSGSPLRLTDCLGDSLAAYWRDHTPQDTQVHQVVYLQIPTDATDKCVQQARIAEAPFTCTADLGELYFPPSFQQKVAGWFSAGDLPYAYASVMSHEYGHWLQLQLHDPQITNRAQTQAQSRALEQQADCLSGVWAHDAALNHRYDAGRFNAVASDLIKRVSSNAEVYTHGTPDRRIAALDRGLGTGRPSACGLAGLH